MRTSKQIRCRWCEQSFADESARKAHSETCHVKARVQFIERQGGRALGWNEVKAVRDRARKEIAMERDF
jgi:hypothetical protein